MHLIFRRTYYSSSNFNCIDLVRYTATFQFFPSLFYQFINLSSNQQSTSIEHGTEAAFKMANRCANARVDSHRTRSGSGISVRQIAKLRLRISLPHSYEQRFLAGNFQTRRYRGRTRGKSSKVKKNAYFQRETLQLS